MPNPQFEKALDKTREIDITVIGRKSGKSITLPIWFVHETGKLKLLPVRGAHTNWLRNLRKNPTIQVQAGSSRISQKARLIEDKTKVGEVAQRFSEKYGAGDFKRYYPIIDVTIEVPIA